MKILLAKYIIIFFGLFFILVGFLMLFKPEKARETLRKAGSTNLINYAEITIRIIPAAALITYSDFSKFPEVFRIFGCFMLFTSLVLYFVPRQLHHNFSNKSADILKPLYFQFISSLSFIIGLLIIYSVS
ncbi:Transmembrane protein of unknown function [Flavobacterium indicum GPTSA100-9 = DSM 17447]|uniref:DUF4149 domain-containing protein n=1 Tax=Flavobacterium indicum (strain DSM 17447 / CIP 109464 / GPTSA100-9) TaxID=1094466 RepID=H8XT23_FLAIG|nr:hypothetical protein [Flavobacterium indicum]CCG53565.1 Transmembrane protein of unknown function [Flavobacterium indicum GPTSA100-9 = DSM 17447]